MNYVPLMPKEKKPMVLQVGTGRPPRQL